MNARLKSTLLVIPGAFLALALLIAVALPFWFGRETEKTYNALLDQLARGSGPRLTTRNYERGWFGSTAETVIRHPDIPFELVARHRIRHGPLPLGSLLEGDFRLTPVQARITSEISIAAAGANSASLLPPLTAETTFGLRGDGSLRAEMPSLKKTGAQGRIDWRGLSAEMAFDREWKKFRLEVRLPRLALAAGQSGDLTVSDVSLHSSMQQGAVGYFSGDGALTVGRLEYGNPAGRLGLHGLEISTSVRPAGDDVNFDIRYRLKELRAAEERFGPGELLMEARRLDAAALVKFGNEVDAIYRVNPPAPQAAMMVAGKTLELVATLSKKVPELKVTRLSFTTPDGEIAGKAKFSLDGRKSNISQNPVHLLMALSGDLEVSVPAGALKRLLATGIRRDIEAYRQSGALTEQELARLGPEAMAAIVDRAFPHYVARHEFTRFLIKEDERYKFAMAIRRGELLINGQPWHAPVSPLARRP